jgi:hypothetical protein
MLLETMKSCFNRDYQARPSIPVLLKHPYVKGGSSAAASVPAPEPGAATAASNAQLQEILQKIHSGDVAAEDLLRQLSAGASTEDLSEVLNKQKQPQKQTSRESKPAAAAAAAPRAKPQMRNVPTAPALRANPSAAASTAGSSSSSSSSAAAAGGTRSDLHQQIALGQSKLKKVSDRERRALKPGPNFYSGPPNVLLCPALPCPALPCLHGAFHMI